MNREFVSQQLTAVAMCSTLLAFVVYLWLLLTNSHFWASPSLYSIALFFCRFHISAHLRSSWKWAPKTSSLFRILFLPKILLIGQKLFCNFSQTLPYFHMYVVRINVSLFFIVNVFLTISLLIFATYSSTSSKRTEEKVLLCENSLRNLNTFNSKCEF